MQWMSVGSGVEHAESGGTPKGETTQGFQIWLNVPAKDKMLDPTYGTEAPEAIPQEQVAPGAMARLLAGPMGDRVGAFKSKAFVQVVDFDLAPDATMVHEIPTGMDTCMLFVYEGEAVVAGESVARQTVVQLDASSDSARGFQLTAGPSAPVSAILFAGKRLNEPIAWHGPIVMNTQTEIDQTFRELRSGNFPPVRVDWDYRQIANKPKPKEAMHSL
jgi:redox-sensitive bicupin YhaK (pirin superfamily)